VVNGMGIWWRKMGLNGTNVNELTSQQLTDLGAGPVFYDCWVEVEVEVEVAKSLHAPTLLQRPQHPPREAPVCQAACLH
jgi:hypothetical protein